MKTKLTLSVDSEVVTRIKRLAGQRQTSVSQLFEEWSSRLSANASLLPLSDQLRGEWKQPPHDADARMEFLRAKHLR
ncbi:MAG: DUF6364 family protein [Chthoniobacterales bacterium]